MADLLNVDEWLAGLQKPKHPVRIYQRPDLAGQIESLEKQLETLKDEGDEESLGESRAADVEAEIEQLAQEFHDASLTVWVTSLGPEEIEEIAEGVRSDLKKERNDLAEKARNEARQNAKRLGLESPQEINRLVRESVEQADSMLVSKEANIRILAKAIVEPAFTVDQIRTLGERLGQGQLNRLEQAFRAITNSTPEASVPKLSRRGTGEKDASL